MSSSVSLKTDQLENTFICLLQQCNNRKLTDRQCSLASFKIFCFNWKLPVRKRMKTKLIFFLIERNIKFYLKYCNVSYRSNKVKILVCRMTPPITSMSIIEKIGNNFYLFCKYKTLCIFHLVVYLTIKPRQFHATEF